MAPRFATLGLWAVLCTSACGSGAVLAQPRSATYPPLLPPDIIDPIPGPFIVGYDVEGNLNGLADGIIANAARSWMVGSLDTYTVCFHPGTDEQARRSGYPALKNVAERLKAHGAKIVVELAGGQCSPDWSARSVAPPYVYIMGAVRL